MTSRYESVRVEALRKGDELFTGDKVLAITALGGGMINYVTTTHANVFMAVGTKIARVIRTDEEIDAELDADDEAFDTFCAENERAQLYSDLTAQLLTEDD